MTTIWKFVLKVTDQQAVEMPQGAQLLSVAVQGDDLCLWAMVDDQVPTGSRLIIVKGTGHPFQKTGSAEASVDLKFVGSALMHGGALVWHVFDAGEMKAGA